MIKQIPNIFTLLNLFFGCLAIVAIAQPGLMITNIDNPDYSVVPCYADKKIIDIPPAMLYASIFIGIAAVIDFLDGFVARLLGASSELGKQLDSLADVVSFGVAPGMIVYQFLRLCYAQEPNALDVNTYWFYAAFIIPCAGAYRLARFNIDTSQSNEFKGVPIPAAGLLIASFPLIYFSGHTQIAYQILLNKWFWFGLILVVSYLMISTLPMLALKFKGITLKKLLPFIVILICGVVTAFFLSWLSVPIGFAVYVIISLIFARKAKH